MEAVKCVELLNFGDWRICGHVPLSMRKWHIFISVNGYQNAIFTKFTSLQNFPLHSIRNKLHLQHTSHKEFKTPTLYNT